LRRTFPAFLSERMGFFILLALSAVTFSSCAPTALPHRAAKGHPHEEVKPGEGLDQRHKAYSYFTMAALEETRTHHKEALAYLKKAIENDPDSVFLKRKMIGYLKTLKDYRGAIEEAKRLVQEDPQDIQNILLLADAYALSGDDEGAIREYQRALDMNPDLRRVRLVLTNVLIKNSKFEMALSHLDRLLQDDPHLLIAHYYRGRIHLERGNFPEAEKAYLEALKLNERMEAALFDLGALYQMKRDHLKAMETYEKLLSYYPFNMAARERLINIYYKLGRKKLAEQQMEEMRKRSKPGSPGRQALGLIYLQHGKIEESIKELEMIVSAWPKDDKSRYYLAMAYEEKEDDDKALLHFKKIDPGSKYFINAQLHIAYILNVQERQEEAKEVLQKALSTDPKKVEAYLMLSSIYEDQKEYDRAISVIKQGLEQDEKNIDLMYRLGVIFDRKGEKDLSMEHMKRILEIDPDHADALNYIGYTYAEQGIRLNEALEMIKRALKRKPNSGYIIDSLGWVYFKKGLYKEAREALEKAYTLVPNDPTISEHLGDLYHMMKDYHRSLDMYRKAMSLKHPEQEKISEKIEKVKRLIGP